MAKSRGRKFAEITTPTNGVFDIASVPTITNAKLQNSAMTLAGSSVSLGGTGVADTDALSEGSSNLYFTDARVQTFLGGGTLAGNVVVPDNRSIYLGSDSDFRMIHNTTNTQLINATGALQITSNGGFAVTGAATFSSTITATGNIVGTLGTAAQPNITSLGTLTALTVDNITIDGTEIDLSSGDLTLDVAGDIILDADGGDVDLKDGGTTYAHLSKSSNDFFITNPISDGDILLRGNDGGSFIAALTLDMSTGGTAYFADDVRLTDNHAVRLGTDGDIVFYHDNSNGFLESAGNFTLDVAGDIILDAAGNDVIFKDTGTTFGQITNDSGNMIIYNAGSQMLKGLSSGSNAQFIGNVGIGVTPEAWHSGWKALQIGPTGFVGSYQIGNTDITALGSNVYSDGSYRHIETDEAVIYKQQNGEHIFDVSSSGSAGSVINWRNAMTIDNSGHVGIGVTPPAQDFGKYLTVNTANLIGNDTSGGYVGANQYYDGAWKYQVAAGSSLISFENDGDVTIRQAASGSANGVITYSENFKVDRANAYIQATGASQVRLTLGSTGTPGTNTANWIRGNSNLLQFNTAGGNYNWEVSGNTKMTLTSSGLFGVGSHTPDTAVHIQGSGHQRLKIQSTGSFSDLQFKSADSTTQWILFNDSTSGNNSGVIKYNHSDNSMRFRINDVDDRLVIDSNGTASFGGHINTSSSSNITAGAHSYNTTSGVVHYGATGRTFMDFYYDSYGAEIILLNNRVSGGLASVLQYRTNSVVEGTIRGSGSGLEFSNNSDYRKKKDIRDLTGSLDVINSLQPRLYKYREGFGKPTRDFVGFIAHEIQEKMPNLVDEEKDAVYTQTDIDGGVTDVSVGDPKYQTVSYSANEMITRLVGAIQEQQELIETLQAEVKALKGE